MKYVQIGILAALVVVGALLFKVWQGQQKEQPTQIAQEQTAPETAPAVAEAQPAAKPSPAPRWKPAPKAAVTSTAAKTEPAASSEKPVAVEAPPSPPPATAQPAPKAVTAPLPPPPPRKVTIEAGTLIPVRLSERLSTETVQTGEGFVASLDKPLVADGLVIAERGARLEGRIVEAVQAGRVQGVAQLGIQLVSLRTSDGQTVKIQTETFRKEGPTTKKEDAAKVGAGAGIGAAIGAIAGGGKGAAIGAAVGGAAGAGTVAATRGKPAELASETRIDFRLSAPVTVTEKQ